MRKFYFFTFLLLLFGGIHAQTQIQAPLPAHGSQYTGNVRGYWFTAPTCFTITGLEVASEAGGGLQNIAVMRLYSPPPLYSATTNVFTTLFLTQNNPASGIIPANIQIEAGDIIMVLGQRGNINSYSASGSFTTTINGQTMAITRSGMQYQLGSTAPQELWSLASGQISRVWMYYDSVLTFNVTATPGGPGAFTFTNDSDSSFTSVWDYGDGSPLDTAWSGSHTYATSGTYTVCSYITTGCGTDTVCTSVTSCGPDPVSAFTATPSGFSVSFSDSSTNATSWLWDFGDGSTDTIANPTHTYGAFGWYYVCLITTNACSTSDTLCDSVFVCVPPTAAMSYQSLGNDSVAFMDGSTFPSHWAWDFGDGSTDTTQNPLHIYTADGTYIVCLTVTNLCGTSTACDTLTVCVTPLIADFSFVSSQFSVTFTDNSTGATSHAWDFGDGNTSTATSPTHTYAANGTYIVCLTTTNDCGETDMTCDTVLIDVVGVTQSLPGFDISLAPNPLSDITTLLVQHNALQGNYTLEIMDIRGALAHSATGQLNVPMRVDATPLAHGMYVFRVVHEGLPIGMGRMMVE